MTFVDSLLTMLSKAFGFIGDMLYSIIQFLAKPLSYIYYFFDGVFYFLYQLFNVVVKVIMIFVALVQFFGSIVLGFLRTVMKMLTVDFSSTPIHYPDSSLQGITVVLDLVRPMGLLTVVPLIILALTWFYFIKKMIGLLGGVGGSGDA